ncbi:MAG: aconitate hydratase, partial [Pseudomonadales bacterium]
YADVYNGNPVWNDLEVTDSVQFDWPNSTYVKKPTFFAGLEPEPSPVSDIKAARCLVKMGNSITTDHISPAGNIDETSPAGEYLTSHQIAPTHFNSYGSRRGNHEVMMRGTFANVRLRNQLAPGTEGSWTSLQPSGEVVSIFAAAERYGKEQVPLIVLAGAEYGTGSSRDWAAKGPALLGVRAVIAVGYERIHRSNLIGMGILPLQFKPGESADTLGLDGTETFDIGAVGEGQEETLVSVNGGERQFAVDVRIDTPNEYRYYQGGGILQFVLRNLR